MPMITVAYGGPHDGWNFPNFAGDNQGNCQADYACSGYAVSHFEEAIYHLIARRRFQIGGPARLSVGTTAISVNFYGIFPDFVKDIQCRLRYCTASPKDVMKARAWTSTGWSDWKEGGGTASFSYPASMTVETTINTLPTSSNRGVKLVILEAKVEHASGDDTLNGVLLNPRVVCLPETVLNWGTLP